MNDRSDRALTPVRQKLAAEALAAAFDRDPFMTYLFPNTATRERNLVKLFLPVIRCSLHYGGVELAPRNSGASAWIPGQCLPLNLARIVRSGLIWTPLTIGFSAFRRLQAHDGFCEHEIVSSAPDDFAYLWLVGVHPKATGQGIGKQLIRAALENMRDRGHSACLLRTDNEKNVSCYEHLGFKLVRADVVPESKLQYWVLSQELR